MFMLKSTHHAIVERVRAAGSLVISHQHRELETLRAQLAERQVPAVRGSRGRFVKREG